MAHPINPLLSVCVQTYNQEHYIKKCLDGILMQQTTFQFEIILGEDESNDGTRVICKQYANQHPDKIKLFLRSRKDVIYIQEVPTGRYNLIENLKTSTGKYIALCEGDDYWTDPLKLQKQVDFLEANEDYNICFHKVNILNQETGEIITDTITRNTAETTDISELARGNYIHTASVVLRNNFKLPEWFRETFIGDWSMYMIMIANKKIKKFDEPMAIYRVHNSSMWSSKPSGFIKEKTLKSVILVYENALLPEEVKSILHKRIHKKKKTFLQRFKKKVKKFIKGILNTK